MARQSTATHTREALAVVSVVLLVLFFAHAVLGGVFVNAPFSTRLAWIVWAGVALAGVHVVLSVATTVFMWTDRVRPASARKKRHQVLKWASGCALAVCAAWHIALLQSGGVLGARTEFLAVTVAVVACLAWHTWVGTKSLTHDLKLSKRWRAPLRIVACALAALVAAALLLALA